MEPVMVSITPTSAIVAVAMSIHPRLLLVARVLPRPRLLNVGM